MRYAFALAVVPLAAWAVWPAAPPLVKKVKTESIRAQREDEQTFHQRWEPVMSLPPATVVRVVTQSVPVPEPARLAPALLRSRPARLDICTRHRMHKVYYGRTWRCRK